MQKFMSPTLALTATLLIFSNAHAGTLSWTKIDADWSNGVSTTFGGGGSQDTYGVQTSGAVPVSDTTGTIYVTLSYSGTSVADAPPATVTFTYAASMTGKAQVHLTGTSNPSGGGSSSYRGSITDGSGTTQSINDAAGPLTQGTTSQDSNPTPKTQDLSNQTVNVGGWTTTSNPDGTTTSTVRFLLISGTGHAEASLTAARTMMMSFSSSSWSYTTNMASSLKVSAS